jgi:hypothetical protein
MALSLPTPQVAALKAVARAGPPSQPLKNRHSRDPASQDPWMAGDSRSDYSAAKWLKISELITVMLGNYSPAITTEAGK